MTENEITEEIIGCAIKVHRALGPGLLESAYDECLYYELVKKGLPLVYEEIKLECGYSTDLFVEKKVIVEVKSVEALNDIHLAQLLTYLKLANVKLELLINFNVLKAKNGLRRVVNNYSDSAASA